jgi:CheY-like chemotaxis protein
VSRRRSAEKSAPSLTILVVDDYPQSAESFAYLLSQENLTVSVAHSGEEALQVFDELRPRVVILDVVMKSMTGFDVARAVRSRAHGTKTLLIAITGWEQDDLAQQCHNAGFNAYFLKPVKYAELKKLLAWWAVQD